MEAARNNGSYLYAQRVQVRLGRALQEVRERRGLSRSALARRAGVSRDELIEIEEGRVHPSCFILCQLAAGLGLTLGELIEEMGE